MARSSTMRYGILNRNAPGAGNIMWSSDYPHSETTLLHSHAVIARDFEGVPENDIREICLRARTPDLLRPSPIKGTDGAPV